MALLPRAGGSGVTVVEAERTAVGLSGKSGGVSAAVGEAIITSGVTVCVGVNNVAANTPVGVCTIRSEVGEGTVAETTATTGPGKGEGKLTVDVVSGVASGAASGAISAVASGTTGDNWPNVHLPSSKAAIGNSKQTTTPATPTPPLIELRVISVSSASNSYCPSA